VSELTPEETKDCEARMEAMGFKKCPSSDTFKPSGLFDVLVAIVNTAQIYADRSMVEVCNDNFIAHGIPLLAEMTGTDKEPIRITPNTTTSGKDGGG